MEIINNYDDALRIAKPYIEHLKKSSRIVYKSENDTNLPPEVSNRVWKMSEPALINTLKYLFEKLHHSCYMLCIGSNEYKIFKLENLVAAPTFKQAIERKHIPRLKTNTLITDSQKQFILKELENPVRIMQCILKKQYRETSEKAAPNEYADVLSDMELPNGVFILNLTDAIILKEDGTEPFPTVTGNLPLGEYNFNEYLPILSMSGANGYRDIPIPNYDDITIVFDSLKLSEFDKFKVNWDDKEILKAVFRGGPSGCGYREETNMRIKLVSMEFQEPDNMVFLDVALTGKGKTIDSQSIKFDPKYGIGMLNTSIKPGGFISMLEQSNYKYIIHIDGNVNAYRLLTTMRTGSLILRVKSEYRSWVDHLIQRNVHYIEIDADLSNLEETIVWCLDNDEKCKKIAKNGLDFAIDVLQKPFIKSYVQKILWSLSKYQDKESGSLSPINSPIKSSSSDIIKIQLGDVIQLIAPDNETFNQQFYVKYIDLTKIVLGNINTMQVISLSLTDGQINDRDIQSIELLSRAEYPGYARQNKLVPGVWLNIYSLYK